MESVTLSESECESDAVFDADGERDGEADSECESDAVLDDEGESDEESDSEAEALVLLDAETEAVSELENDGDLVSDSLSETVGTCVSVDDSVAESEPVTE